MKRLAVTCAVMAMVTAVAPAALATGGEGEAWPTFTESSGCGAVFTRSPEVGKTGRLSRDRIVRGPWGAMFGRTLDEVAHHLTNWKIPGTASLRIHERLLPALELVAESVEAAGDDGERYRALRASTYGYAFRTIGGETRMSRHAVGNAMDISSARNPFSAANRSITDMPDWFVAAFTDAGLCWGGNWIGKKDTMHYSWQGPAFTPGADLPEPFPPLTDAADFTGKSATIPVMPEALPGTFRTLLVDGDSNGVVDVVRLAARGGDVIVDVSRSARRHNACSVRRYVSADALPSGGVVATGFGDWDGRGGPDLWFLSDDEGKMRLTVRWRMAEFSAETSVLTGLPALRPSDWISTADYDRDGSLDLFVVSGSRLRIWSVDPDTGATELKLGASLPFDGPGEHMLGDRDGDELPDVWYLESGRLQIATAASGYREIITDRLLAGAPTFVVDASASDYDGDGRADVIVFDGDTKHVWLGNTVLPDGAPLEIWFELEPECEEGESTWDQLGIKYARSGWTVGGAVQWLERYHFPAGCDPREDDDCRVGLTRASDLAPLLAWILDLEPGPGETGPDAAASALEAAGYASPCPVGAVGCWHRLISRAESAARIGMVVARRQGATPDPHRWVVSG